MTDRAPTPGPLLSDKQFRKHLWALLADNRPLAFATGTFPPAADALLADREECQRAAEGYAELVAAMRTIERYKAAEGSAGLLIALSDIRHISRDALARVTGAGA